MSIIIKGVKMPGSCTDCPLFENKYHFHGCHAKKESFDDMSIWNFTGGRPTWCPLVELPPHGRLIEADALKDRAYDSGLWANGHDGSHQMVIDIEDIDDAPTIIEAEGEKLS